MCIRDRRILNHLCQPASGTAAATRPCSQITLGRLVIYIANQTKLPHCLWKIKVQICDKLQTLSLMKRNIGYYVTRFGTVLLSSLQQLLEMSAFCPYIRSKTLTPLVNCIVNDALVNVVPNVQQTLLQFVNAVQLRLMYSLLGVTPYLVIDQIKLGAIRRLQIWRNESGCWLLNESHSVACPVCKSAV